MTIPADEPHQNVHLKLRNAQLESDAVSLSAEAQRLRQTVERLHGPMRAGEPPGGAAT